MNALKRYVHSDIASPTYQIMRGTDTFTESLFTMRRLDDFVPKNHPCAACARWLTWL